MSREVISDLEDVGVLALHVEPVVEPRRVGDLRPRPATETALSYRDEPALTDLVLGERAQCAVMVRPFPRGRAAVSCLEARGVSDLEAYSAEVGIAVDAVARHPGLVVDKRLHPANHPVEER